ncbi:MAG: hypothetical protein EYX74_07385 [Desulfobulbaceae bacterium]|nr:MAG: hypothetical protein EYX74_07385 [Desulfobulbaceae bacterium]
MEIIGTISNAFKGSRSTADTGKDERLRQATADFEAIIINKLLKMVRDGAPKDGLIPSSFAQDMYRSMQDQELAQQLAAGRGIGFGEKLYQQITQQQTNRQIGLAGFPTENSNDPLSAKPTSQQGAGDRGPEPEYMHPIITP